MTKPKPQVDYAAGVAAINTALDAGMVGVEAYADAAALLTDWRKSRERAGLPWKDQFQACRAMRERATAHAAKVEKPEDMVTLATNIEALLAVNADKDFDAYMLYMEWGRNPQKRFYDPRRKVLKVVADDLQDLFDDELDFYSLSCPPRIGKTTICCFFMTFNIGNHPDVANLMSGYADKLTISFYNEVLSIITDEDEYRFAKIFPKAKVKTTNALACQIFLNKKTRFPALTCRPVEGSTTGAVEVGRGGLLYCDDMVKNFEQAVNSERMDKLYSLYLTNLYDRCNPGSKEMHIGTRWVPNDIIGRIEDDHGGDKRYRFRNLPALNEHGESNFLYEQTEKCNPWPTEKWLEIKARHEANNLDDVWAAKYMCAPYWREGLMFPEDELYWYDGTLPEGEPDGIIAVCDTKDKGDDYACMPVGYIYGDRHFIHDCVCDNGKLEIVEEKLAQCLFANNVHLARFESNAAGGHVAREVEDKCRAKGSGIEIRTKYSTENKEVRIVTDSPWIKSKCYFRSDHPSKDYDAMVNMLTRFSGVSKHTHDDAPDALSMYCRFAQSMRKASIQPVVRRF